MLSIAGFLRFIGSVVVFILWSHGHSKVFHFLLIDLCDQLGFCFTIFSRRAHFIRSIGLTL